MWTRRRKCGSSDGCGGKADSQPRWPPLPRWLQRRENSLLPGCISRRPPLSAHPPPLRWKIRQRRRRQQREGRWESRWPVMVAATASMAAAARQKTTTAAVATAGAGGMGATRVCSYLTLSARWTAWPHILGWHAACRLPFWRCARGGGTCDLCVRLCACMAAAAPAAGERVRHG